MKAVIIDDEEHIRIDHAMMIREHCPEVEIVGEAANAEQALMVVAIHKPEIIFLDITMPGITGLELLQHLQSLKLEVQCIIVSAYDKKEYYQEAIRLKLTDYLLKPMLKKELCDAVARARERMLTHAVKQNMDALIVHLATTRQYFKTTTGALHIPLADIAYMKSAGRYTELYLTNGAREILMDSISDLEKRFEHTQLRKIDRFYIINKDHVEKVSDQLKKITFGKNILASSPEMTKKGIQQLIEIIKTRNN